MEHVQPTKSINSINSKKKPSHLRRRSSVVGSSDASSCSPCPCPTSPPCPPCSPCPLDLEVDDKGHALPSLSSTSLPTSRSVPFGPFLGMLLTAVLILWSEWDTGILHAPEMVQTVQKTVRTSLRVHSSSRSSNDSSSNGSNGSFDQGISMVQISKMEEISERSSSDSIATHNGKCNSPTNHPNFPPPKPPKMVAIHGERHSATNLFRELITRNGIFETSCASHNERERCDSILGWKHGFLYHRGQRQDGQDHHDDGDSAPINKLNPINQVNPMNEQDILSSITTALLVRDAFSWLISMYYEPYNMVMEPGTQDFDVFLTSGYSANECEDVAPWMRRDEITRAGNGGNGTGCAFPMERAENLIQLRTAKYRNWVEFFTASPNNVTDATNAMNATNANSTSSSGSAPGSDASYRWSIVKLESLLGQENQERTVTSFFDTHCISSSVSGASNGTDSGGNGANGRKEGQRKRSFVDTRHKRLHPPSHASHSSHPSTLSNLSQDSQTSHPTRGDNPPMSNFRHVGRVITNSDQSFHHDHPHQDHPLHHQHHPQPSINGNQQLQQMGYDTLAKYTTPQLHYVLNHLDLEFEKRVLGYDYGYVVDYIDKRKRLEEQSGLLEGLEGLEGLGQLKQLDRSEGVEQMESVAYQGPPTLNPNTLQKRLKLIQDNVEHRLPGRDVPMEVVKRERYKERQQMQQLQRERREQQEQRRRTMQ